MRAVLLACLISVLPRAARADEPVPEPEQPPTEPTEPTKPAPDPDAPKYEGPVVKTTIRPREIVIDVPGLRTTQTNVLLGSLLAAGAIVGAVGLKFHLDSRSSSNSVSAQLFTGKVWTAAREQAVQDADRSRTRAAIAYTAGGLLVTATIIAYIVTEPKSEQTVIRPHHASIAPIPGGAIAGAGWSF